MKRKSFTEQTLEEFKRETIQSALNDAEYLSLERLLEYAFDKGHLYGGWEARKQEMQHFADRHKKTTDE